MAFAVDAPARHPLFPAHRAGTFDDAYSGFTRVADRTVASALLRTRPLDHARGHRYQGPRRLPGPDSHRQAIPNLSLLRHRGSFPHGGRSSLGARIHNVTLCARSDERTPRRLLPRLLPLAGNAGPNFDLLAGKMRVRGQLLDAPELIVRRPCLCSTRDARLALGEQKEERPQQHKEP